MSQMQRSVNSFSAWYFGVRLIFSERRPEAPLQGELMNTASGRRPPAARRMSSGVASRQPVGGSLPWNRTYWSRVKRSSRVPGTPARRSKSRNPAGSTSIPPRQTHSASTLPTRGRARLKPAAPPPRPQQKWKW